LTKGKTKNLQEELIERLEKCKVHSVQELIGKLKCDKYAIEMYLSDAASFVMGPSEDSEPF